MSSLLKGDNSKRQLGGATILACITQSSPDIYVSQISLKSQRVAELLSTQTILYKALSRDIAQNGRKGEQPLLHVTYHLDLIYMYTIFIQNISVGIRAIESANFPL